eukprot:Pgem_evm1s18146
MSHNKIESMSYLGNLPNLQHVHLSNNRLNNLGRKTFVHTPNLLVLQLQNNNLKQVNPGELANCIKLES